MKRIWLGLMIAGLCLWASTIYAEIVFGPNVRVDDTSSSTSTQGSPSLALDASGNIYVAWSDNRNGNYDIYFSKSTDGGLTFEPDVRVDDTETSSSSQSGPSLAVDYNGHIYIAWQDDRNGNLDIYCSRSSDEGVTFEADVRVDDTGTSTSEQQRPSLAVDAAGNVYVVWVDGREWLNIFSAKSTDGGATFETNVKVNTAGPVTTQPLTTPSIAVGANGFVCSTWNDSQGGGGSAIHFAKSLDGGSSFELNVYVPTGGWAGASKVAVDDASGIIYVIADSVSGDTIVLCRSTDGGLSFEPSVQIDDDPSSSPGSPSVALDSNGFLYVAWSDNRNGTSEVYFDISTDQGATFNTDIYVPDTPAGTHESKTPSLAVDAGGNVYIAWTDERNGNPDIFFAKGQDPVPNIPPIAEAGADVVAGAWEEILVDGSASYDPDGTIENYKWSRVPDNTVLCSGTDPACEVKTTGKAEEVIELEVTDNRSRKASDALTIINRRMNVPD
ncbi:hypothetical protein ACFL38_02180 [Candidatus Omnitrophota bacterium]